MSFERWDVLESLFERVLKIEEQQRTAFLESACGNDTKLRHALERLLEADRRADGFLEPSCEAAQPPGPSDVDLQHPPGKRGEFLERVGPYRILRQVGQGGMATAYLAIRDDDAFQRRVVVKVVRRGMERSDVLRRLLAERRILAALDHPNVARLYDGGSTQAGLPYFVMEYVEGLPIDEFCDRNKLTLEERLDLFRKVCGAVGYAHQNLVIHRDLKPSNILVTADCEPKLLDFGIAKLLNPEIGTVELEPTETWLRVMTPQYASPEQAFGKLVTTRSDVYSLGVLLYRLLTGQLPLDLKGRSLEEVEHILWNVDPRPPSATENRPEGVGLTLESDLDAIVLKCLRSQPHRRYFSVESLAEDVERYQRGLPVEAHKGTWAYLAGKFLRRHRVAVAIGAVVLAFLTTVTGLIAIQSVRLAQERDLIRLERDKKQAVLSFVLDFFFRADPDRQGYDGVTVADLLDRNAPNLADGLRDQPEIRSEILHVLGVLSLSTARYSDARTYLEESIQLRRESYGPQHPEVAHSLGMLARVTKEERGDFAAAEAFSRQALDIVRQRVGEDHPDLVGPLNELVSVLCWAGEYSRARVPAEEALTLARRHLPVGHLNRLNALRNQADIKRIEGDYEEAASILRRLVTNERAVLGTDHPRVARTLGNQGMALLRAGRLEQSEPLLREALAINRSRYGDRHGETAWSLATLGGLKSRQGDYAAAVGYFRETVDILREIVAPGHSRRIFSEIRLTDALVKNAEAEEGERLARAVLDRLRRMQVDVWIEGFAETVLGDALAFLGRDAEAEALLVDGFEKLLEADDESRPREGLERLVRFLREQGREPESQPYVALFEQRYSGAP